MKMDDQKVSVLHDNDILNDDKEFCAQRESYENQTVL